MKKFVLIDECGYENPEILKSLSYVQALEEALQFLGKYVKPCDEQEVKEIEEEFQEN